MKDKTVFRLGLYSLSAICLTAAAIAVNAAPQPKPPCGTSGALGVTDPAPGAYDYIYGSTSGTKTSSLTVSSPSVPINGNSCDPNLDYVFGNGDGDDPYTAPYTVSVGGITYATDPDDIGPISAGDLVSSAVATAIKDALSDFQSPPFQLKNPGTGNQTVSFTFTDAGTSIPVGDYDIAIDVKPNTGNTCGDGTQKCNGGLGDPDPVIFALTVKDAPAAQDTLPPTVDIRSPTMDQRFGLNATIPIQFTSIDPPENGAGTGVIATRSTISSCGGEYVVDLTSELANSPTLPQDANVPVTSTASFDADTNSVGSFALKAEADDNAGHTGMAVVSFSVGANIAALPPISVSGRRFNTGSTVPVKWTITNANGHFVAPYADVSVTITDPNGQIVTRYAGDGAAAIRWELDDAGNAVQYITNYPIPELVGIYTVKVFLGDVCGDPAEQGSFTFVAASKGGKV